MESTWQAAPTAVTSRRINSSLVLQQLLYYNCFWSAVWILTVGVRVYFKYGKGLTLIDPDVGRTVLCMLWLLVEPIRLSAGFYGNLQENVPWLIVFGAVTLIPQTVVCFYMFLAAYDLKPFDQALQMVMVICIFLEFILTIRTVYTMAKAQKEQYYLYEHAFGADALDAWPWAKLGVRQ